MPAITRDFFILKAALDIARGQQKMWEKIAGDRFAELENLRNKPKRLPTPKKKVS